MVRLYTAAGCKNLFMSTSVERGAGMDWQPAEWGSVMALTKVKFERFTAFKDLEVEFSPGINALVGANGTGKTHLMKACYAAYDAAKTRAPLDERLIGIFLPSGKDGQRLIRRGYEETIAWLQVRMDSFTMNASLQRKGIGWDSGSVLSARRPTAQAVYIPPKETLVHAPGFLSLFDAREVHFEEVYRDLLLRVNLPPLRQPIDDTHRWMLESLENIIGGKVAVRGEEFFLINEQEQLEFTLLAEGWRKLGLLWLLIRNGTLQKGSVLFWDEPETNLNPKMFRLVINVLLELQRAGAQIFFATHDYVILKELDLQMTDNDKVAFHSMFRDETSEIACHTTVHYLDIHPNTIGEAFDDLYDRQIERSMRRPV